MLFRSDELAAALNAGTVSYREGRFAGKFSAAVSRALRAEGAVRSGTGFVLREEALSVRLRALLAEARRRQDGLHAGLESFLAALLLHIAEAPTGLAMTKVVDLVAEDVQQQFTDSVAKVAGVAATRLPEGTVEKFAGPFRSHTEEALRTYTFELAQHLHDAVRDNRAEGEGVDQFAGVVEAQRG